jgi:steroid Delta-isomerase
MTVDLRERVAAYAACFEQMTPATVSRLREVAAADVRFKDPFNDVRGIERMERCMHAMFADASDVRFKVLHWAIEGDTAYLRWRFWFKPKRLKADRPWEVEGLSELRFDAAGLVAEHIDHWDAASQFYARLPVLGGIIRWVQGGLMVD